MKSKGHLWTKVVPMCGAIIIGFLFLGLSRQQTKNKAEITIEDVHTELLKIKDLVVEVKGVANNLDSLVSDMDSIKEIISFECKDGGAKYQARSDAINTGKGFAGHYYKVYGSGDSYITAISYYDVRKGEILCVDELKKY